MGNQQSRDLSADEIFGASDLEIEAVEVQEWGGTVYLRALPADEGIALNERLAALAADKKHEGMFLLLAAVLCDAKGAPLGDSDGFAKRLRSRSQKVLLRLQAKALALQGWEQGANPKGS